MSLDPDTMDEDSFREGLELMEQLEVRVPNPKKPTFTLNLAVMSLDPDTMDEDSFREGLELMEQLEVRAYCHLP